MPRCAVALTRKSVYTSILKKQSETVENLFLRLGLQQVSNIVLFVLVVITQIIPFKIVKY
jgi:hypothetical protein